MPYLSLGVGIVLNAAANILIKTAMRPQASGMAEHLAWQSFLQPSFMGGLVCYGLALLAYSVSLSRIDLSIGYPIMTSLGLLIVVGYSAIVFKEHLGWERLVGVGLILLGVVFVFQSGKPMPGPALSPVSNADSPQ